MVATCGRGRSCETVCPVMKPGKKCRLTLEEFALLLDRLGDPTPDGREVFVPVRVV